MIGTEKPPSMEGIRLQQIEEWLRQSDRLIRAADELLQKVLGVHPQNALAPKERHFFMK